MTNLGYTKFVCDIFPKWEEVKDELLMPDRKSGTGNGTIHVFLGAADNELRKEFPEYYSAVANGENPSTHAVHVKHFFLASNLVSLLGYICQYDLKRNISFTDEVRDILEYLDSSQQKNGLLETSSLFKLSTGSSKLRPYFKQFESTGVFTKLVRKILLPNSSYKISLYKNDNGEYAAFWLIGFDWQSDFEADSTSDHFKKKIDNPVDTIVSHRQIIYYGAPGTGKSHTINALTSTKSVIRTTFHPDSDYSTFVGAYKPTTEEQTRYNDSGVPVIYHDGDHKGEPIKDKVIVYDFVEQAFLKAYEEAWKKFFANPEAPEDEYLVIEEINRGNCAQIFGDLFQLLDRNQYGYSEYPITADNDISKHLKDVFTKEQLHLDDHDIINHMYNRGDGDIAQKVLNGDILLLPMNLYIWATMNTSDQSLFPIDSAFKRRWDWQYVKIADAGKGWKIKCGDEYCDWWTFIEEINKKIAKETSSDDKKLGYFFCKPSKDSDTITEETFVGKVLFYLWNDVFKDGDITLFKVNDEPEAEICFDAFYSNNNKVNVEAIRKFLVGVVGEENIMSKDDVEDQALEASLEGGKVDRSQYTFNGTGKYGKSKLGQTIVDKYLNLHKELTFDEIKQTFPDSMLNDVPGPGLIVKEGVDLKGYQRYYKSGYTSSDGINYLIYKQWTLKNIQSIIEFAKKQNWSVEKL